MPPLSSSQRTLRFGDFVADFCSRELRKNGIRVKLQVQPFQLLQALLERPGEVITREELQKRIWPEDTFVDFNQGLNNAIKKLREALGDDAERPRFIQTLTKRGYRFVGSIQDGRNDFSAIGETEASAEEFAEEGAEPPDKVEDRLGSSKVQEHLLNKKTGERSREFSRGMATGVLFSALVVTAFLVHSYPRQFGELLIQLGQRLEGRPATLAMVSAPAPVPAPAPKVTPQQSARFAIPEQISIAAPISLSPLRKPYLPAVEETSVPRHVEFASVSDADTSPAPLTALPISDFAYGLNMGSLVDSIEVAQPQEANDNARESRGYVPPYVSSTAGKYLDIGKYRDALRANQIMDELAEEGFYGTIVHNRTLWLNSYHIMVGPFINEEEIEAVRPGLESRGFSPQVLPSRSRRFSLPPMTMYGTDLTIRDCIVTWETNSPEATVKFTKGKRVIATVRGRWEKREFVPKWNAIISQVNKQGPETLLEFQWHYTDRVLVLDGDAFKFYPSS